VNGNNVKNVRCEIVEHSRITATKSKYLKDKINELETNCKNKILKI
jgi:hypothetical protein